MHRALRTFSAWDTYNYDWISLKFKDPFHGFYVTASIMEIMLQAWATSTQPSHPAWLSFLSCMQVRGRATMENCSVLLSIEKKWTLAHILKETLSFLICRFYNSSVVLQAYPGTAELNSSPPFLPTVWVKLDMDIKMLKMLTYSYSFRTWVTFWSS